MNRQFEHVDLDLLNVTRVDNETGRYYICPTGDYLSVTTILGQAMESSGLDHWRARVGNEQADRISTQAKRRGTSVHQLMEDYVNNIPEYERGAMPANIATFRSLKSIIDQHVGKVYGTERLLYSSELKEIGRAHV